MYFNLMLYLMLTSVGVILSQMTTMTRTRRSRSTPKCMIDLGCFAITDDFRHKMYRLINLTPDDRETINTTFLLYTRPRPEKSFLLKAKNDQLLDLSGFDSGKKTVIMIHGFQDKENFKQWMVKIKDEFFKKGDYNVILVDWTGGNGIPYAQATSNTRVVGAEIAFLLNWLKDIGRLELNDVHILGHSLGAHIAGYAGERLHKLGRITGMDPAKPYFENLPANVRLDVTDADFVDVIHTDSVSFSDISGFGMKQLVGHVDFFPNNGRAQPGCESDKYKIRIVSRLIDEGTCNHMRAVDFFQDSINIHKCIPVAYACANWETFLSGKCVDCGPKGDMCSVMGQDRSKYMDQNNHLKYFLKTSDKAPFCLFHYQVTLTLRNGADLQEQSGKMDLTLKGNNSFVTFNLNDGKVVNLLPGTTYTFLITTQDRLGYLRSATFSWDGGSDWMVVSALWGKKEKAIAVDSLRILPMNGVDKEVSLSQSRHYCTSDSHRPLKSKHAITFDDNELCKSDSLQSLHSHWWWTEDFYQKSISGTDSSSKRNNTS